MQNKYLFCALIFGTVSVVLGENRINLRSQILSVGFSGPGATRPFLVGNTLPASCSAGEAFFKRDAPAGANLYLCTSPDTWNLVAGLDGTGAVLRSVLPVMGGDSGSGGQSGAVPAPVAGEAGKCLKGSGDWGDCDSNHALLSGAHSDTTGMGSEQAGDLLLRNSANTRWERLGKGSQHQVLLGGSAVPGWGAVTLSEAMAVTGILGAANGGTGSGFTAFAGPAGSTKTFSLPNASATILTDKSAVTVPQGGTGLSTGTSGGIPYFSSAATMASSPVLTLGGVLLGGGPGNPPSSITPGLPHELLRIPAGGGSPSFGPLDLAQSAAVSGVLMAGNGGTGNAFFEVVGPGLTRKTFTFPDASATVLTTNAAVTVAQGGTGITGGTSGGIPYFSGTASISASPSLATNTIVLGGGTGAPPTTVAGITVQTAAANGTELANAGDNKSLARSDHEHMVPWQVAIPFTGVPSLGDFPVRLPVPASCGGNVSATSVRVMAAMKGTGPMMYQVYSCTNGLSETCLSMFSTGNQTYSNTGNVSQQVNTDQNNSSLAPTSFFKASIAATNGQVGVTLVVNGRCKNI
jgi:hypothetical protein